MSEHSPIKIDSDTIAEACAWIAQLESGNLTSADFAALREWMARSPAHASEIRAVAEISGQLSILTELTEPLATAAGLNSALRNPQGRRAIGAPAFVAIAFVLLAGVILVLAFLPFNQQSPKIYRTAVGEYQTVELADGSTIKLNTATQIEVDYGDAERRVRLVYGEAFFEVAPNPHRPFIVYSDAAIAEAVGTSFIVRLRNAVTELAVVEGIVAFTRLPESINMPEPAMPRNRLANTLKTIQTTVPRVMVNAGQAISSSAIFDPDLSVVDTKIPAISKRDIKRKLSWTEGLFDFSQTPLEEVVAEVTRHTGVLIEITDPSLKDLKFGGIFRIGDIDPLLEALASQGIEAERRSDSQILLYKAEND